MSLNSGMEKAMYSFPLLSDTQGWPHFRWGATLVLSPSLVVPFLIPLAMHFTMARNLRTRRDSHDLSTSPAVRSSVASTLQFNVSLFTFNSTMEIRWQQKPHSMQLSIWDPASEVNTKLGLSVNLWTSYKLLKILNKALEWRHACRETASSVWDPAVKENGCEQPVSNWWSKTWWSNAFTHFVP